MNTYHITGLTHWNYYQYLHARFLIDEYGQWWPVILMEMVMKEMNDQLSIPPSRMGASSQTTATL